MSAEPHMVDGPHEYGYYDLSLITDRDDLELRRVVVIDGNLFSQDRDSPDPGDAVVAVSGPNVSIRGTVLSWAAVVVEDLVEERDTSETGRTVA